MNREDIFKLLEQLGVRSEINGNTVRFYDMDTNNPMTIYETKQQMVFLDDFKPSKFFTIYAPSKMVRIELGRLRTDQGVDENGILPHRLQYDNGFEDHVLDFTFSPRSKNIKLQSFYKKEDHEYDHTEIIIDSDSYVSVDNNGQLGSYLNGNQHLDYIDAPTMLGVIDNNRVFEIFMNYYGGIYPDLKNTYDTFKQNVSGMHM